MAPEALAKSSKEINLRAADMWSFAVLLWEMATREEPFRDLAPMEAGMKVSSCFSLVDIFSGIARYIFRLFGRCSVKIRKPHIIVNLRAGYSMFLF